MKNLISVLLLIICTLSFAQSKQNIKDIKYANIDASPLDITYFPTDAATGKNVSPILKIVYSRPQSKGRVIFGNLVKYNEVWRFGANETTELKVYKPIKIDNQEIAAGTYSLFAIPGETSWTIIINKSLDSWGAYTYNATKDVLRIKVPVEKLTSPVEYFSICFSKTEDGAIMNAAWDTAQVSVPISF